LLGQINATLPVFSGFKIQNSIIALDNLYQAENANAMQPKEVAMQVVNYYARTKNVEKKIKRVPNNADFTALEKTESYRVMIYLKHSYKYLNCSYLIVRLVN
jgi:hypothetical protein